MAKINVNAASRDELVEAGVRAEIADEIVKLRRKEPITSADALDQIQGVGPATLDQLRRVLDFSEPHDESDRKGGGERGHQAERAAKEGVQYAHDAGSGAVRGGAAAAQGAAQSGAGAMRSGLQVVQHAADAVGEAQRETAQRSAEGTAELGQAWMELVQQQSRHNVQTLTALTRAVRWDEVLRAQGEFLRASVERIAQFTQRWLETSRSVMGSATAAAARDRRDRAA
ncbi:MAG TPA: helix-hairpin-helix domain-containing protein [Geminicoccaceae bacterium]|nr:helix-hairpin-helix domain-containing protein [Geminicoccaceae bacterium]